MKTNLYLIEFYVKDPVTCEGGYEIKFAWVYAYDEDSAWKKVEDTTPFFDEIIQITEQSEIFPLAGEFVLGRNLFIIGSPDDEMTDKQSEEPVLKWSNELPTEPGWYWCRKNGNFKMGELWSLDRTLYFGRSAATSYEISHSTDCDWYGPLIPPAILEVK